MNVIVCTHTDPESAAYAHPGCTGKPVAPRLQARQPVVVQNYLRLNQAQEKITQLRDVWGCSKLFTCRKRTLQNNDEKYSKHIKHWESFIIIIKHTIVYCTRVYVLDFTKHSTVTWLTPASPQAASHTLCRDIRQSTVSSESHWTATPHLACLWQQHCLQHRLWQHRDTGHLRPMGVLWTPDRSLQQGPPLVWWKLWQKGVGFKTTGNEGQLPRE